MASTSTYGLPRPPDDTGAGCPSWMDPEGKHGKVIVLSLKAANEGVLPKNHPFTVGKSIQLLIGNAYTATTESKGTKYILKVRQQVHATKLLGMKTLFDGTPVEITAHPTLNYSRCIVNCSEVNEMSQEDLLTELAPQGVIAICRFTKMVDKVKVNTSTMVLTMEGTTWPQFIYFGALRVPTRFYYPVPMLCFNCLEYGHTKARCKSASRCQNCSAHEHKAEDCKGAANCFHCKEGHKPTDRNCPVYKRENEIVKIKAEQGLSFGEAKKIYDSRVGAKSYANISKRLIVPQENNSKDKEIESLKAEITALRNQLTSVIAELKSRPSCQCKKTVEGKISKQEQRNKRAKEISPEITTGTEFRPPPLKKVSSKMNNSTQPGNNSQIVTTQPMLEDPIETVNSDTNTEEMSITDNESDRSDTIVINRKGKKKFYRTNNATTNQQ
ncbi:uncharacterized protein LOC131687301 [Topomyia yanbarensis]|uniref:uncharacterized protein LOC131687301 n=1 Tax=Topomyia yanbarensis TaxID=2498891 RepID=UPI00273CF1E2|nr:uncharacterized protein LOC131687301 [Topomyia yanbarensis]